MAKKKKKTKKTGLKQSFNVPLPIGYQRRIHSWPINPETAIKDYKGENARIFISNKPTIRELLYREARRRDHMVVPGTMERTAPQRYELADELVEEYDWFKECYNKLDDKQKENFQNAMVAMSDPNSPYYYPPQVLKDLPVTDRIKASEYGRYKLGVFLMNEIFEMEQRQKDAQFRKVDLGNTEWVRIRIRAYLASCARIQKYPSLTGLAVNGFGLTPQRMYQYLQTHDDESTEMIKEVEALIANAMTEQSIQGYANPTAVIFQLKNQHGYRDEKVNIQMKQDPLGQTTDPDKLKDKYLGKIGAIEITPTEVTEEKESEQ